MNGLRAIEEVVAQYSNPAQIAVAGGPLAASLTARLFWGRNKVLKYATAVCTAWLGVKTLAGPVNDLIGGQFGNLHQVFSGFGG